MTHKKTNPWMYSTVVLAVLAVILLILVFRGGTSMSVSKDKASEDLVSYLNTLTGGGVQLVSASDIGNLYEVQVSYQGQQIPVYITKDGNYFVQSAIDISGNSQQNNQQSNNQQNTQNQRVQVSEDDDAVEGDSNAPVTIVEFSDYECPYCGRFFSQTLPSIREQYVDTGKVRIVFRDFPLSFHENAQKAAEAAECAGEQGGDEKYFEMHDKLFGEGVDGGVDTFKQYAKDIGLNSAEFNDCLDSGEMAAEVEKDLQEGQSYGISGTPGFFINGIKVSGAQPFEAFRQIIDQELA